MPTKIFIGKLKDINLGARFLVYFLFLIGVVYVYETKSNLNDKIEEHFYAWRIKHKPAVISNFESIAIRISPSELEISKSDNFKLSVSDINKIHIKLKDYGPKKLYYVFPFNSYPYQNGEFNNYIKELTNSTLSPYVGVLNTRNLEENINLLPPDLKDKVLFASFAHKESKNNLLTEFPVYQNDSNLLSETFISKTALIELDPNDRKNFKTYTQKIITSDKNISPLNQSDSLSKYLRLTYNYQMPQARDAIDFSKVTKKDIAGKVVIVGFDFSSVKGMESKNKAARENYYSLAPWSHVSPKSTLTEGIFYSEAISQGIENILKNNFLKPLPKVIDSLILILIISCTFIAWTFSMEKVGVTLIAIHILNYLLNLFCFSYLNYMPNISRVVTYSAIAATIGAFLKSQRAFEKRLSIELRTKSQNELSIIHNKFLKLLSKGLRDKNKNISESLKSLVHDPSVEIDQEAREVIESAASGADELKDYLDSLANCSDIEENKLKKPASNPVNLIEVLNSVVGQCHPARRNIEIEITPAMNNTVENDDFYLHAVIYNLVSNAIKYSPEGEKVKIEVIESEESTMLEIKDNGPGIPDELKERIFEKFYRIKDDRAFTTKGTGLGLYLTKFFAEIIGCSIEVADNSNGGSKFTLNIPRSL